MIKAIAIKYYKTFLLSTVAIVIVVFEQNNNWVEKYYYGFFYPKISFLQRSLTSWISFSIGDILYIFLGLMIIFYLIRSIKNIFYATDKVVVIKIFFKTLLHFLLILFIVFKLLWGLNYSRQGIAKQLDLQEDEYCKEELIELSENLIFEANYYRKQIEDTALPVLNLDTVFNETKKAYKKASEQYSYLKIDKLCVKTSIYSFAGNYFGYTGYYNPFTGEVQVRSDIPSILLPFISCHEIAHQLGYASEEEANFVAYLVAKNSNNIYLKYSTCLELIDCALNELLIKYYEDFDPKNAFEKIRQLSDCLDLQVKKDRKSIKLFFFNNKKNLSSLSSVWYDNYLKINYQSKGISSYNQVIGLIFAYLKK